MSLAIISTAYVRIVCDMVLRSVRRNAAALMRCAITYALITDGKHTAHISDCTANKVKLIINYLYY